MSPELGCAATTPEAALCTPEHTRSSHQICDWLHASTKALTAHLHSPHLPALHFNAKARHLYLRVAAFLRATALPPTAAFSGAAFLGVAAFLGAAFLGAAAFLEALFSGM